MLDGLRQHRSYLAMRPGAHLSFTGLSGIMQVRTALRIPSPSVFFLTFVLFFVIRESGTLCVPLLLYKEVFCMSEISERVKLTLEEYLLIIRLLAMRQGRLDGVAESARNKIECMAPSIAILPRGYQ